MCLVSSNITRLTDSPIYPGQRQQHPVPLAAPDFRYVMSGSREANISSQIKGFSVTHLATHWECDEHRVGDQWPMGGGVGADATSLGDVTFPLYLH